MSALQPLHTVPGMLAALIEAEHGRIGLCVDTRSGLAMLVVDSYQTRYRADVGLSVAAVDALIEALQEARALIQA